MSAQLVAEATRTAQRHPVPAASSTAAGAASSSSILVDIDVPAAGSSHDPVRFRDRRSSSPRVAVRRLIAPTAASACGSQPVPVLRRRQRSSRQQYTVQPRRPGSPPPGGQRDSARLGRLARPGAASTAWPGPWPGRADRGTRNRRVDDPIKASAGSSKMILVSSPAGPLRRTGSACQAHSCSRPAAVADQTTPAPPIHHQRISIISVGVGRRPFGYRYRPARPASPAPVEGAVRPAPTPST